MAGDKSCAAIPWSVTPMSINQLFWSYRCDGNRQLMMDGRWRFLGWGSSGVFRALGATFTWCLLKLPILSTTPRTPLPPSISPPQSQCSAACSQPSHLPRNSRPQLNHHHHHWHKRWGMQTVPTVDGSWLTREPVFTEDCCHSIDDMLLLIPLTHSMPMLTKPLLHLVLLPLNRMSMESHTLWSSGTDLPTQRSWAQMWIIEAKKKGREVRSWALQSLRP